MHLNKITLFPDKFPTVEYYPFNLPVFQKTETIEFHSPVTFFVGENGTGKTTLLKAIARKCGIHIWGNQERSRYVNNPYEDDLSKAVDVEWMDGHVPGSYFGSDLFRSFVTMLDEWAVVDPGMLSYFGGSSLMTQSHGQSLMSYFRGRYKIKGLFFLDEPETALSPKSQLDFVRLIHAMSLEGHAQFIVASHSPIIMACPDAEILSFDMVPITSVVYEATEHFQVYKQFMTDRERCLWKE